jgi:hypothetical protein
VFTKTYYLKKKTTAKDSDGTEVPVYSQTPSIVKANIFPASGKVQAEMYGERLNYILNMLYSGTADIVEDDGVCVYVSSGSDPDYKVISIKRYSDHKLIELEKVM